MPSGAKKRKALKKKKEQESIQIGTANKGNNGDNLHGNDDTRSQDEKESDGDLNSPGSQGNDEAKERDRSDVMSSVSGKTVEEESRDADIITQRVGLKGEDGIAIEAGSADSVLEIVPAVDSVKPLVSVPEVVKFDQREQVEASPDLVLVKQKSAENMENLLPRLEKGKDGKMLSLSEPVAEASKEFKNTREYEIPEVSDEKPLLASGPPIVQKTSWLSCCGLFDVMTGSGR